MYFFRLILLPTLVFSFFAGVFQSSPAFAKTSKLLVAVEDHYKDAKTVKMDVSKVVTMKLLQKEKKSDGTIQIKKGGKLRWETESPDHSLVLSDGHALWLVDYPSEEDEKPTVIKAPNPRHSQPHAVVAFLMGQGRITDDFAVIGEKNAGGDEVKMDLKPKKSDGQVRNLTLFVDKNSKNIEKLSFEDSVGNTTELDFKNIRFNTKIENKVFKFTPPKGADVNVVD